MSVGRGWAPIEADLRAELAAIGVTNVSTHQKCGWLKVEASPWSPEVQEICDRAEARSRNVCEDCGASPAERHRLRGGWIKTLCDDCRAVIRVPNRPPSDAVRDRLAQSLREWAGLVRREGWSAFANRWNTGERLGVRGVLDPAAVTAACPIWAPILWGEKAAEIDAACGYQQTRRWFAMVAETDPDAPERIVLSAPRMLDLHPRMRALLAGGWEMTRMEKPVAEGFGIDVVVWFERPKQGEGS